MTVHFRNFRCQFLATASLMFLGHSVVCAQSLTWLGTLGGVSSTAYGVSDNGVVVGYSTNSSNRWIAFRWQYGVMQSLGVRPGDTESLAYGVSSDGQIVVGWSRSPTNQGRAVRWVNGVIHDLGDFNGTPVNFAYGVSADGMVVVGHSNSVPGSDIYERAFRWTPFTGFQNLGALGLLTSRAYAVSANGNVVVGATQVPTGWGQAFRWENDTMVSLGHLGGDWSEARGVSADGSVVVGSSHIRVGFGYAVRAFRWQNGQMHNLGTLGGNTSRATGVSGDGMVVVGMAHDQLQRQRAFHWENGVMENLNQRFASHLTNGSFLDTAYAISPNGRYIVGDGYNAATGRGEAFLLDMGPRCSATGDVNGNGCVDDSDLLAVLFAYGSTGQGLGCVDITGDGRVDDADLLTVLFNFGGC